jgi:hypothetical protein
MVGLACIACFGRRARLDVDRPVQFIPPTPPLYARRFCAPARGAIRPLFTPMAGEGIRSRFRNIPSRSASGVRSHWRPAAFRKDAEDRREIDLDLDVAIVILERREIVPCNHVDDAAHPGRLGLIPFLSIGVADPTAV